MSAVVDVSLNSLKSFAELQLDYSSEVGNFSPDIRAFVLHLMGISRLHADISKLEIELVCTLNLAQKM